MKSRFIDVELEEKWLVLLKNLSQQFDGEVDIQGILFLIGVQELGKGYKKYKKDEKVELMHIAICTLLEPYGYYNFKGVDDDNYPHWEVLDNLPALSSGEQLRLMKEAIVMYFEARDANVNL